MKSRLLIYFLQYLLAIPFLIGSQQTLLAQKKSIKVETKGKVNIYNQSVHYNEKGNINSQYIYNKKYNLDEVYKQRIPDSPTASFLIYRLNTHEAFLNAFYKSFGEKRISSLAKQGVEIEVHFILDKKGGIVGIVFRLSKENNISILEIEQLEMELEEKLTFDPIEKSTNDYASQYWVCTNFNEIDQGKITKILNQDERIENWYIFK